MPLDSKGIERPFHLVSLKTNDKEYTEVKTAFTKTMSSLNPTIVSIQRLQNPNLYRQYAAFKMGMVKRNPTCQNEKWLWHGTTQDTLKKININGFNRSFAGVNGM